MPLTCVFKALPSLEGTETAGRSWFSALSDLHVFHVAAGQGCVLVFSS